MQQATGSCLAGTVTLTGRVTASYTGTVSSVPFYLQPTLGGADFDGIDTLRGLVDYRLRAPDRLLVQVDFDKPIAQIGLKKHPLGEYGLYTPSMPQRCLTPRPRKQLGSKRGVDQPSSASPDREPV
jgi:hypothetical protein